MYPERDLSSSPPPTLVCHSKLERKIIKCRLGYNETRGRWMFLLLSLVNAAVQMESGPGGLGCPSAPLVEPPSWRKSTGLLGKLLWSDHPPLLHPECWRKNANLIKHSHLLHGAGGRRVEEGGQQGPPGETTASHLKCYSTKANGKMHVQLYQVHFDIFSNHYFCHGCLSVCLRAGSVCGKQRIHSSDKLKEPPPPPCLTEHLKSVFCFFYPSMVHKTWEGALWGSSGGKVPSSAGLSIV